MCPTNKNPDAIFRRQIEAKKRSEAFAALSPEEKVAELDKRLGVGVGARRQRIALMAEIMTKSFLKSEQEAGIKLGTLNVIMGRTKAR